MEKWFDELLSVDEAEFDRACRGILLTLFGLMEEAMTSDDDKCLEKLLRDYFVKESDEENKFKELVECDLPSKLQNNRVCAIYLVEILKTILDDCVYTSVKEMT